MSPRSQFTSLMLQGWRQFGTVNINFGNRLTILTGVNGSGKTTLLRLLAHFVGEPAAFLATPLISEDTGKFEWWSDIKLLLGLNQDVPTPRREIGQVQFSDGNVASLSIPSQSGGAQVKITVGTKGNIRGFFVPSHRPLFVYQALTDISVNRKRKEEAFSEYTTTMKQLGQSGTVLKADNVSKNIKSALLNWGYVGYGNQVAPRDQELVSYFEGFQDVLRKLLPEELQFKKYEIRSGSEIVFVCENGEFLLETASGGITSLIHLAWLLFNFDSGMNSTILIDEIENHLHPSLQRIVLPNLLRAFPEANFIVTSHSPMVVNSVRDATVYALKHNSDGAVEAIHLDFSSDAMTASSVLDEVLGVPVTIPIWAEDEYEEIVDRYSKMTVDEIDFEKFRDELTRRGLKSLMVSGMDRILESKQ